MTLFFNKTKTTAMVTTKVAKLTVLSLTMSLSTVFFTGCNKKPDTESQISARSEESKPIQNEDDEHMSGDMAVEHMSIVSNAETLEKISGSPAEIMSQLTLNIPKKTIEAMVDMDVVPLESKSCLQAVKIDTLLPKVVEFHEQAFTEDELKQLSEFHTQEEVYTVIMSSIQKMMEINGLNLKLTDAEPTEEGIQRVTEFAQTPLGQKHNDFNLNEDAGTMNDEINTFMEDELDKCGL